jgi:hypothetical protein
MRTKNSQVSPHVEQHGTIVPEPRGGRERVDRTDEELLHAYYAADAAALDELAQRHNPVLEQIARLILQARTGSALQALAEWDTDARLVNLWGHVVMTSQAGIGSWPYQRLSALTWFIYLLCLEMDRHLGLRGPF